MPITSCGLRPLSEARNSFNSSTDTDPLACRFRISPSGPNDGLVVSGSSRDLLSILNLVIVASVAASARRVGCLKLDTSRDAATLASLSFLFQNMHQFAAGLADGFDHRLIVNCRGVAIHLEQHRAFARRSVAQELLDPGRQLGMAQLFRVEVQLLLLDRSPRSPWPGRTPRGGCPARASTASACRHAAGPGSRRTPAD